jgi:hypothetical protein
VPNRSGPRDDINKLAIRRDYAQGSTNLTALGRKYNVRRQTIAAWVKTEQWPSPKEIAAEVRTETVRQAVAQTASELVPNIAAELASQSRIAAKLSIAAEKVLDEFNAGSITPGARGEQTKADVFNAMATAIGKAFDAARIIHGLTPGNPSVAEGEESKTRRIIFADAEEIA